MLVMFCIVVLTENLPHDSLDDLFFHFTYLPARLGFGSEFWENTQDCFQFVVAEVSSFGIFKQSCQIWMFSNGGR